VRLEEDAAAGEKRFILGAEEVEYDCTDSEDERESEAQKQRGEFIDSRCFFKI
jgi:hypothetical protein